MSGDILNETADKVRSDIEFLLDFVPATDPDLVVKGLAPCFYVTGTYEGDVELARKAQEICERYDIELDHDDEEDFEGIE